MYSIIELNLATGEETAVATTGDAEHASRACDALQGRAGWDSDTVYSTRRTRWAA